MYLSYMTVWRGRATCAVRLQKETPKGSHNKAKCSTGFAISIVNPMNTKWE